MKNNKQYSLDPNWKELPLEGDGGLRHLRMTLGAHWVLALKQNQSQLAGEIFALLEEVRTEMKKRNLYAKKN